MPPLPRGPPPGEKEQRDANSETNGAETEMKRVRTGIK